MQNADEMRLWMADGIAHDLRPWFTKFNAKPIDQRWLPVVEQLYCWHYQNERYLRNEKSLARVAMVYSQQTATFYGGEKARAKVEDHALGFYQALVEARIPFEMVHDACSIASVWIRFAPSFFPTSPPFPCANASNLARS